MLGIASMLSAGAVVAGASAASAHVGATSATCEVLTVNLTNFQPILAAQPEEGYTEYQWSKTTTETLEAMVSPGAGWTATAWEYKQRNGAAANKWQDSPDWNAEFNDNSNGWTLTGNVRYVKTTTETTWSKTSPGKEWVKTGDSRFVKTKDAQPARANHVTVTINGATVTDADFGASYSSTFPFADKYQANDWSVSWTAYDDPAFTGSAAGTSTPCVRPGPQDTPDTDKIEICHSTGNGGYQFINPSKNSFYDGHRLEHDDIYPSGSIVKQGQTLTWDAQGDQSLLLTSCVAPSPNVIAVPAAPGVNDPCGADNATWVVPGKGGNLTWHLLPGGDLEVNTDVGYTFPGGQPSHNFGHAPETNKASCPVVAASVAVAPPVLTPPTCTAAGVLTYSDHLGYTWHRTDDHGNVVLTAIAKPGFTLTGRTSWTYTAAQLAKLSGARACPPAVIPPKVEGVKHTAPPKAPVVTPVVEGVKHEAAKNLPRTGSESGLYGAAGLLLLMVGSGLVLATRQRSNEGRAH